MERLQFERVTLSKVLWQAHAVRQLVQTESDWLRTHRPNTLAGYSTYWGAVWRLGKTALVSDQETYIGKRRRAAKVLGSIGRELFEVANPEPPRGVILVGRHIDYWAASDVTTHEHLQTTRFLAHEGGYRGIVMATLAEGEQERAEGITRYMPKVGNPGILDVRSKDVFGLHTLQLQLYATHTSQV